MEKNTQAIFYIQEEASDLALCRGNMPRRSPHLAATRARTLPE
jgi:hypothetical protein